MKVAKYILPVVVGAMAGMILIKFGEDGVGYLYPLPPGSYHDRESLINAIKQMPDKAFILLLINYMVCSFIAGLVATLVSKRTTMRPPLVVGFVLTLGGLYNAIYLEHPIWFTILNLVVYMPFAWLGYVTVRKKVAVEQGS